MKTNEQPTCKLCKTDSKMIWRGDEWICHGTHALDQSPNERPTPRTDNEAGYYDGSGCWKYNPEGECVTSDFARDLERKLAERTEERDLARATCHELTTCGEAIKLAESVILLEDRLDKAIADLSERTEERDAALAKLAKCREALVALHGSGDYTTAAGAAIARQTLEETK